MTKKIHFLAFCFFTFITSYTHAQVWTPVGSPGFTPTASGFTSMAIDSGGSLYVAYTNGFFQGPVNVMKYDGTSWAIVGSPDFSAGLAVWPSLALDTGGSPYVVYQDEANSYGATAMKYDGSSWVTLGTVAFSAGAASAPMITIDRSGTPYVVYEDGANGGRATVMKFNGSTWVNVGSPGFTDSAVTSAVIAVDKVGTPYVAFSDFKLNQKATVMKYNGSSWTIVGSAGCSDSIAQGMSIAIDTGGAPYIVYADYSNDDGNTGAATVLKYNGSSWVFVGTPGFATYNSYYATIAIDKHNTPYVAFESGTGRASAMRFNGSSWVPAGLLDFSAGSIGFTSIAIDGNGIPYVAYSDYAYSNKATVMELVPPALPISGPGTVCIGDSITLSDATSGGSWSSSNPFIAAVGAGTGVVTGVSAGVVTISYTTSAGSVYYSVTVNGVPSAGTISGASTVCISATDTLSDATPGGIWSTTDTAATVGSTGIVSGVDSGRVTITYTVDNGCGTAAATFTITINPIPDAGIISGIDSLCPTDTITLLETIAGGTWSSTHTTIASVSDSGRVAGLLPGLDTITYTVTVGGCTATTGFPIKVRTTAACTAGVKTISDDKNSTLEIAPNPNDGVFSFQLTSKINEEVRLVITNIVGEKVKEQTTTTNKKTAITLNAPPGIYFITSTTSTGAVTAKMIAR